MWLIAALLLASHPQATVPAESVPLPTLATDIYPYLERPIRTCGELLGTDPHNQERVLFLDTGPERHDGRFFLVDPTAVRSLARGSRVCVSGIVRRRDGIPYAEVRARGLGVEVSSHNVRFPEYVFYPTRVEAWSDRPASVETDAARQSVPVQETCPQSP